MNSENKNSKQTDNKVALALAALAMVLYLVTLCPFAYPILSAPLLAANIDLDPIGRGMQHPLWGLLVSLIAQLPIGTTAIRCNLLGAVFAVLSVWLIVRLVSSLPAYIASEAKSAGQDRMPHAVAGIISGLFLMLSLPFWFTATRAHPGPYQVFLLLTCVSLLAAAKQAPANGAKRYFLFAFVYGVAAIDFPTLYLLLPVFGIYLLHALLLKGQCTLRNLLGIIGSGLLGLALIVPLLWSYMRTDSYQWLEYSGFGNLLWNYIKTQGIVLLRGTPKVGWLLILLFSILPWFAAVFLPQSLKSKRKKRFGTYFLLLILYACGFGIMFNRLPAPFYILGVQPLLVTPYVFVAWWFGHLTGFWVFVLSGSNRKEKEDVGSFRRLLARLVPVAVGGAIVAAAFVNYSSINPRQAAPVAAMAEAIIDDLNGRTWLISNGELDANLALVAHERGIPLKLISVRRTALAPYRNYLASLFDSPRLKAMAEIGLNPLLEEWSRESPDLRKHVAILHQPDLWYAIAHTPIPSTAVYFGRVADGDEDAPTVSVESPPFWQTLLEALEADVRPSEAVEIYLGWTRNHMGKLANNRGVVLADEDFPLAADEAFQTARRFDPDNISALLNRYSLSLETELPEKEAIASEIEAFSATNIRLPLWALSHYYGYVRSPGAFLQRGWSWAMSGKPAAAIEQMERAVASGASGGGLQLTLAALYYQGGRELEAEQKYYDHLEKNPSDFRALMSLSRIAMRKGDYDTAQSYLVRLLDEGAPANLVRSELAAVAILRGDATTAQSLLEQVIEGEPKNQRALGLLAMLLSNQGKTESLNKLVERIRSLPDPSPNSLIVLSSLAEASGDLEAAREHLERVVDLHPGNVLALERLLNLDAKENRMDLAEKHVRALLTRSPRNARGNLVLGSIQYARGELVNAEASLRASVEEQPTAEALNSLGWLVLERGDPEEALELSERALALNPTIGHSWDTKGVALMELGRLEEAEPALIKAIECEVSHPSSNFHLAQLYAKQGRNQQAIRILKTLETRGGELPAELFNKVTKLLNELNESS